MILSYIVRAICAWRRYRRCVYELSKLSDLELTDIGISRSGITAVAWRSAQDYIAGTEPATGAKAPGDQ
jgi:uncharacterized protein YjiS (DUF1127 family)